MNYRQKNIYFPLLILFSSVLNIAVSILAGETSIPLYMDSFATIAIASMGGFVPSIIVAILTNGTLFLLGRLKLIFILCQMMTALGSSFIFSLAKKNGEEKISLDSFMMAGFLSAFTNGIFGSLFAAFYHYNLTAIEQGILFVTNNMIAANLIGGFLLNLLDKAFAAFIAYGMYLLILKKCERAWSSCKASHWTEERTKENDEGSVQGSGRALVSCGTPDRRLPAVSPSLKIKPEYFFLIIAFLTFAMAIGFKKTADRKFSEDYENIIESSQFDALEEKRSEEEFINKGFDSVLYTTFILAAISILIMQVRLGEEKNKIRIQKAREETQRAFSRDLHDGAIQTLAALKICLSDSKNERAKKLTEDAITQARELLAFLRIDLSSDLIALVRETAKVFEENYKTKIAFYEASDVAQNFSSDAKVQILKILQEALRNALKHSGADKIEIKMIDTMNDFILSVCDNGSGFDVEKPGEKAGHAGLKIMEERAIELGGHLAIKSGKDGTNVSLILPIGVF
ncbi:MAG: ATP-binding protein [Treponema sp.]|uniref:sensor histidine kinase n=1 Tax=Treponema sp. TaxID=166 RepID=UPI0025797471|nr:ATP-binding protein [Treponema sp.]MDD6968409.1 ATP-binding protein [Spirochaetales bacterium]MDY6189624.1 ATP-binding protein [Treponema sp.]